MTPVDGRERQKRKDLKSEKHRGIVERCLWRIIKVKYFKINECLHALVCSYLLDFKAKLNKKAGIRV